MNKCMKSHQKGVRIRISKHLSYVEGGNHFEKQS